MKRAIGRVVLAVMFGMGVALPVVSGAEQPALAAPVLAAPVRVAGVGPGASANTFVPTGSMVERRAGATATLLPDGDVLVAGGGNASAEIYHPGSRYLDRNLRHVGGAYRRNRHALTRWQRPGRRRVLRTRRALPEPDQCRAVRPGDRLLVRDRVAEHRARRGHRDLAPGR